MSYLPNISVEILADFALRDCKICQDICLRDDVEIGGKENPFALNAKTES
jgi:hypothetical protein